MTERVDFYILKSAAAKPRLTFACRLIEKAYLRDMRVLVVNDTLSDAQAIDDLLWTFGEHSFVPHTICADPSSPDPATPVQLTVLPVSAAPAAFAMPTPSATPALPPADLLVNLSARLPEHWERHPRVAEIVDADEQRRRLGRERFKVYRDQKVALETHQHGDGADA
ncbi:MAG TPA: DNA polymerase III subunit chi [Steroidobacteraceae bacterium]|nr:DNA polymerase III subunit chi [Steroidobacteraceae bacterium]